MRKRVDYEARFAHALRRITAYMTPSQLRRECGSAYGVEYQEALEMAYENVLGEAHAALKGYRPPRKQEAAMENEQSGLTEPEQPTAPPVLDHGDDDHDPPAEDAETGSAKTE